MYKGKEGEKAYKEATKGKTDNGSQAMSKDKTDDVVNENLNQVILKHELNEALRVNKTDDVVQELEWKLSEISCSEPEHIESDDLEILGEDEQGRDAYCTIKITEVAEQALTELKRLQAENEILKSDSTEWREYFKQFDL